MKDQITTTATEESQELKKGIKGWQVAIIGMGGVIGSCYFLGVGITIRDMGPAVLLAYILVGFVLYGLMIAYAELLVNLPRKGSFVAYTNEFLGETFSVGIGWAFWCNWVAYVPSEAIAVSIVLNTFIPGNTFLYSVGALLLLTIINLLAVDMFAKVEATLGLIKMAAIFAFIVAGVGILFGLWGNGDGAIGTSVLLGNEGVGIYDQLFPHGVSVIVISMVVVLVTFQGTEIVGLAAAESEDAEHAVPKACKSVTYRIICLYIIPLILLLLLVPYQEAGIDGSIFSYTLEKYGLNQLAGILSVVVMIAAFSCANAGFYGTVRSMYSLSIEGLAPKGLSKLNKNANPKNAVLFTLACMWVVLMVGNLASESSIYEHLLAMSGFTGTICWVGILASQIMFRRRLKKKGYDAKNLKARVKHQWIPVAALIIQVVGLVCLIFDASMLPVFIMACGCLFGPMLIRVIAKKLGKTREITSGAGEITFDEAFPTVGSQLEEKTKE
ncbi:MAG: amino acid permease [Anaerovorax sp.]